MTTRTWALVGGSGNWSTPTNWTPLGVPVAGDDVVIPPGPDAGNANSVTLDVAATSALDSVTVGGTSAGLAYLSVGANTLNITGTGAGATDTLTLVAASSFPRTQIAGGTIVSRNIEFQGGLLGGYGSLNISGSIFGTGEIDGGGPSGRTLTTRTLSVSGTIGAGITLSFPAAVANNNVTHVLEILGTATSFSGIQFKESFDVLKIGPAGSVTVNADQVVAGAIVLEGAGSRLLLGSHALRIFSSRSLKGQGVVSAATMSGSGTIAAAGGTLELTQPVAASTGLAFNITDGARLQLDGTVGSFNTFSFPGAGIASLGLGNDAGFVGTLSSMNVGNGAAPTNFVDIEGHHVGVASAIGQGSTSGTVTLSDGAVLNLTNLTSPNWSVSTADDGAGGTDVFLTTTVASTPHDLNGDGEADIVLQNSGSGQAWLWAMNGNTQMASGTIATPDPGWQVKGTGDLNGDGLADIVLQKSDTGQAWVWKMDGTAIIGGGNIATPQPGWQIRGIADFNGDGRADIVLQNQNSGGVWVWQMNGDTIAASGAVATPDPGWQVAAVGDVNGDHQADIVLQNQNTGQVWVWEMNGNAVVGGGNIGTPEPGWHVITTADVNADGKLDLVWQNNNTGQVGVSEMNGNTAFGWADIGTPDSLNWHVKQASGFTGSGGTGILLQNDSTLQCWMWGLNGPNVATSGNVATPQAEWHIPGING